MTYYPDVTENFKKELASTKYIYCYKIVQLQKNKLVGLYYSNYTYRGGWNKSNRKTTKPTPYIGRGIHVYIDKPDKILYNNQKLIRVKCYIKDLIGCGFYSFTSNYKRPYMSVFTKVWIDKKEIDFAKGKQ
jgi:hypothetical protein